MRVLLLGSGGREHALAWKLAQSPLAHGAPRRARQPRHRGARAVSPGSRRRRRGGARPRASAARSTSSSSAPRCPSSRDCADVLRAVGRLGLRALAGRGGDRGVEGVREGRDGRGRRSDRRHARRAVAPCVLKADGLAAGKGVVVCHTQAEVEAGLAELAAFGGELVIEELLEGPEVSVFALCDGASCLALPVAQDFKRADDGDLGPNTGGMGSFAPVPGFDWRRDRAARRPHLPSDPGRACRARSSVHRDAVRGSDADARTGHACSSTTAASAIRRRSR